MELDGGRELDERVGAGQMWGKEVERGLRDKWKLPSYLRKRQKQACIIRFTLLYTGESNITSYFLIYICLYKFIFGVCVCWYVPLHRDVLTLSFYHVIPDIEVRSPGFASSVFMY